MKKLRTLISNEQDSVFAVILSLVAHAVVLSLLLINMPTLADVAKEISEQYASENKIFENEGYVFLVEPSDAPEEKNEESIFVSDKSTKSKGLETAKPSVFLTDKSIFSVGRDATPTLQREQPNNNLENIIAPQRENEAISDAPIEADGAETYKPQNPNSAPSDNKIPSTFDDGADRAVVFSSETGRMQLGTKAQEYFWYFYTLVGAVKASWTRTIPNQAHFMGLIRSDEVELVLSIDELGNIEFVKFLKRSQIGQSSLDSSCSKAVEYAGKLAPPPSGLLRDYAEDGKIYIPFRFIYQNFSQ